MPSSNDYKPTLIQLMSFLDDTDCQPNHQFSIQRLGALTPQDVERWMKHKAYGAPDPPENAKPTECRANSLECWKKAISFCMPNRLMVWNALALQGNPTRSNEVNNLIKKCEEVQSSEAGETVSGKTGCKTCRVSRRDEHFDGETGLSEALRHPGIN